MKIFDIISSCFQNLFRRKIRTMLTLLGVMLGSVSVALTFALGEAVKQNNQQLLEQNANLQDIEVTQKDGSYGANVNSDEEKKKYCDDKFIESIKKIPGVKAVKYELKMPGRIEFIAGNKNRYISLSQITAADFDVLSGFGFKLKNSENFPKNMENMLHKDSIDIILGEDFDYQFYDSKGKDYNKMYRDQYAPSIIYLIQKYNQNASSKTLPPFVNSNKEDVFLGIIYSNGDKQGLSGDENDNEVNQGQDLNNSIDLNEKDISQYKKYQVNRVGILDWDAVKDSSDYNLAYQHASGAYVNIETGKKLIKQYKKINKGEKNLNSGKKAADEPEFVYENVVVKAKDINYVADISKEISKMGYEAENAINTIESEQLRTQSIQFVFGVLGGITLLVSALSVANTMITSVYERTREIGIMKVIGCKIGNIQIMFLIESAIIGLFGGTIGMGLSFMLINFMNKLVDPEMSADSLGILAKTIADFTEGMKSSTFAYGNNDIVMKIAIIKPELWILVIVGTTLIGLIAGYIPSVRASRVSALKAIKEE